MIRAEQINKTFVLGPFWKRRRVEVLRGFDFHAEPGKITGLLGPNGAGKTTFFRGIAGLEKFDSGTLEVDGVDPGKSPKVVRGRVALLPEEPGISQHDTGRQHLQLFGSLCGLSLSQIRVRMEQIDTHLLISSYWDRPFSTYSRGQKARISIARVRLLQDPSVLIFDEPSNGLDFEAVGRLHGFIRELANEGRTVLVASHILRDLRALCDRLVGLHEGQNASTDMIAGWMRMHAQGEATQGEVAHD